MTLKRSFCAILILGLALPSVTSTAADRKLVITAGKPSHGPGDHEFRARCLLLKKWLDHVPGITSVVYSKEK